MNISNFFVAMAQTTENNQTNLFPFPFHVHLIFSMISTLFFFAMYNKYHKPYQLLMGFAVPISLVIWLSESKSLFYGVGIIELILLFASFLITIILKIKNKKAKQRETQEKKGGRWWGGVVCFDEGPRQPNFHMPSSTIGTFSRK